MKTSWNEIRRIEKYLKGRMPLADRQAFESMMSVNPVLRLNVELQAKVYSMLALYNRAKIRAEVQRVHEKIFSDASRKTFTENILQLFKP
jgi:hypothetical protein